MDGSASASVQVPVIQGLIKFGPHRRDEVDREEGINYLPAY